MIRVHTLGVLCGLLLCAGCAGPQRQPAAPSLISASHIEQMSAASFADQKQKRPPSQDAAFVSRAACIAPALFEAAKQPGFHWALAVFASAEPNASSLPGGRILLNDGMKAVAPDADTLAAALSVVVAQTALRQGEKRINAALAQQFSLSVLQQPQTTPPPDPELNRLGSTVLMELPASRKAAEEADLLGLELMARAGFDPRQAVTLRQNMARLRKNPPPEQLSAQPADNNRAAYLQGYLPQVMPLYEKALADGRRPRCP